MAGLNELNKEYRVKEKFKLLKEVNNEESPLSKMTNKSNFLKEMNVESPMSRIKH